MNSVAPICPISRSQAVAGSPGRNLPVVPRALDLPSLIQTVNIIRNILMMVGGPGPVTNNIYPPRPFGFPQLQQQNTARSGSVAAIKRGWQEQSRTVEKVEINHSEQEVDLSLAGSNISNTDESMRLMVLRFKHISYQSNPGAGSQDRFEWDQKNTEEDFYGAG